MLGKQAAEALKMNVGDVLRLSGGSFKIVGIYNSGNGFEDAAAILSLTDAQQLLQKQRQVGAVQIKVDDPRQIETLRARLEKQFPRLSVSQSGDVADQAQMVQYMQAFAVAIAALAVLIGGVGMTNTVMMSMFERTREIGTLRAVGWQRRRVMVMIFGESVLLGVLGGLIGCSVGQRPDVAGHRQHDDRLHSGRGYVGPHRARVDHRDRAGSDRRVVSRVAGSAAAPHRGAPIPRRRGQGIDRTRGPCEIGDAPIAGAAARSQRLDDSRYQPRAEFDRDDERHDRRFHRRVQPLADEYRR